MSYGKLVIKIGD